MILNKEKENEIVGKIFITFSLYSALYIFHYFCIDSFKCDFIFFIT